MLESDFPPIFAFHLKDDAMAHSVLTELSRFTTNERYHKGGHDGDWMEIVFQNESDFKKFQSLVVAKWGAVKYYDPMKALGKRYKAWDGLTYDTESYDPRIGYWMVEVGNPSNRRNISERAIDRTFHEVTRQPNS